MRRLFRAVKLFLKHLFSKLPPFLNNIDVFQGMRALRTVSSPQKSMPIANYLRHTYKHITGIILG